MHRAWFLPSECTGHRGGYGKSVNNLINVMTAKGGHITSPSAGNPTSLLEAFE